MIGRIFRLVRTPVTLLILLAVLIYAAYWGYHNIVQAVPAAPPTPCVTQTLTKRQLKSSQVYVQVFNGGNSRGLAADVGRSLRSKGFKVTKTTNTLEKVDQTVVVGAATGDPEVKMVRSFFKKATVRADRRPDHSVDVLVGNRYAGFNKKAKTTISVKADTLCLPSAASPSPGSGN